MPCAGIAPVVRRRSAARSANGEGRERSIGTNRSHFARGMRQNSCAIGRFEGMLTEPDTMGVVSKAEDGCFRSDWPPRLLVAVGCPGGVGSRGFQKKRDLDTDVSRMSGVLAAARPRRPYLSKRAVPRGW